MPSAIGTKDWSSTPIGAPEDWPAALKIAVSMMLNSAFPKCLCWGDELVMIYNDAFISILGGKHPCLGRPFFDVWSEEEETLRPISAAALAGEATFIEDFPLETNRNGAFETAYFTFCYSPVCDEEGVVRGMLDTVIETTGKVRAEQMATLRNRELVHRSRNAYGLVSALVNQTIRGRTDVAEIKVALQKRIAALVRAQDVLMEAPTSLGHLENVAQRALMPFDDHVRRISLEGPEVLIGQDQVTTLSLALHELATNSVKYGALSVDDGRVDISWDVAAGATGTLLTFTWCESGGPPVTMPSSTGFGSRIIGEVLPQSFGGDVTVDYAETGLTLTLVADLGLPGDRLPVEAQAPAA
ncbi:HWE histidine kinase domain-containing protein [Pseudoroseicyclus sp. CXY001]|uniref:HWE histidine kinase domain-containing protein n=1 Tax=Pseudoroseicyclus sp. CXY001 TaxID=3242492 RepID=UPI003570C343